MNKAFLPILGLAVSMALLRADDITLTDGTVLKNAKIIQRDDSKKTVTISFSGGTAQVNSDMEPASLATTQQSTAPILPNPSIPAPEPTDAPSSNVPIPKDWTVGGKTFHNVTVTKVEVDEVHIIYDGGIGAVPLASLTPDLQKKFGYNPIAAAQAAQQRQQQEAASDALAQSFTAQQAKQAQTQQIATVSKTNAQRQKLQAQITACLSSIKSDEDEIKAESWKYGNSAKWEAQLSTDQARLSSLQGTLSSLSQ